MPTAESLTTAPPPTHVALEAPRLSGAVPVRFGRTAQLQPCIWFGADRFGTDEGRIEVNGIGCDLAGLSFYLDGGEWKHNTYRELRRVTDSGISYPTDAAMAKVRGTCRSLCSKLYERWADHFNQLGLSGLDDTYRDTATFQSTVLQLQADADIVAKFADVAACADAGTVKVEARLGGEIPETIRWKTPHHTTLEHHVIQAGRGRVVGVGVTAWGDEDVLICYAVDTSRIQYRPDTHRGPLLVPVELVTAE